MPEYVQGLTDVPTAQLMCMPGGNNHHWEAYEKPWRRGRLRQTNSRCSTCGKERARILDAGDRSMSLQYSTPDWHVKVQEPYDAYDVAEEIARRLSRRTTKKARRGHLVAV